MSPEISERALEEAIERTLLRHGPDAYPDDPSLVRETPAYGDNPSGQPADPLAQPGGYRKRRPDGARLRQ